jgi:hypothetical protein
MTAPVSPPVAPTRAVGPTGPGGPSAPAGPSFDALVDDALRQLVKTFRAHQLYLPNNPMYQRALDTMRAAFASVWAHVPTLVLTITEDAILWEGRSVLSEPDRASDSLPWLFYRDGIREMILEPEFEREEAGEFFLMLQRARKATPDEDDLPTMLWERDFSHLRYKHVELSQGTGLPAMSDSPPTEVLVQPGQEFREIAAAPSAIVNMGDFDATLHFLEDREIQYLQKAIEQEYAGDLRRNVISILLDIVEVQPDERVRDEIIGHLDEFLVRLFASAALSTVAFLLRECDATAGRAAGLTPEQHARLKSLPDRLSAPDVLAQLLQTLDERPDLPPPAEMDELFDTLGVGALETLLEWIDRTDRPALKTLLARTADRLAGSHSSELVRLIGSPNPRVADQAIRRAGELKSAAAAPALARALAGGEAPLRLACAQALAAIGSPVAMQALERSLGDADRDVRLAVLRAIAVRAYRPAFDRLDAIVRAGDARETDLTEKMAFFEAYGALCGNDGVSLLDRILNRRSLLRREDADLRACAAVALGRVGTTDAMDALRRASTDREVVVRNAVSRALRGGTS